MKKLSIMSCALLIVFGFAAGALATTITVQNPSFEANVLSDGKYLSSSTALPNPIIGWDARQG